MNFSLVQVGRPRARGQRRDVFIEPREPGRDDRLADARVLPLMKKPLDKDKIYRNG